MARILDIHFSQKFLSERKGEEFQKELAPILVVGNLITATSYLFLLYLLLYLLQFEMDHAGDHIKTLFISGSLCLNIYHMPFSMTCFLISYM